MWRCLSSSKVGNFLHQINDDANLRQAGREEIDVKFQSMSIQQTNDDANFNFLPTQAELLLRLTQHWKPSETPVMCTHFVLCPSRQKGIWDIEALLFQ